jgi:hypothetical protein
LQSFGVTLEEIHADQNDDFGLDKEGI